MFMNNFSNDWVQVSMEGTCSAVSDTSAPFAHRASNKAIVSTSSDIFTAFRLLNPPAIVMCDPFLGIRLYIGQGVVVGHPPAGLLL
mmetsp:Transcript_4330/g.11206  ORF Transcript_4330/g.11206 Transcript_4330/m.11206 type:complete len:86 (-) Transcript_4330:184-441(-)